MSLDALKPTDQETVDQLPYWIRETRDYANAISVLSSNVVTTVLTMAAGTTTLIIPTNLSLAQIDIVKLDSLGLCALSQIRGGTQGQIKLIIAQNNNISFVDGDKTNGHLYLNQMPALSTYNMQAGDVLAIINMEGNGGANNGYWLELFRKLAVK
jgi:hypothetical protein